MSKETVAPTVDSTKLEECSSKQRETKDRYEPSLTWVIYPTGRRVGYLNFTRNKKRYRKIGLFLCMENTVCLRI